MADNKKETGGKKTSGKQSWQDRKLQKVVRDDIDVIFSGDKSKARVVGRFAPKANPEYFSGSTPTCRNTFGWIIPAPPSSSQPVDLHTPQPSPPQITQEMATSAPGSTNGK